ncbi:hypothetical protein H6F86_20580 [Phormidium sp. FACHB-592]|uniref:Uncharacterized protein n=1 Tax=Stenomitos frigidus AS-A4 TaxID=2933935 RepID=A0ABV0KEF8_9CYAN|nr:hypothetical protein [Phormidium sp. FACHB-592]MBD2076229.1 hypothetical protein [Phormidium sp. FACHB-592]
MKIPATEVKTTTKDVELDVKAVYKEPHLTVTVDGLEVLTLTVSASTSRSASGADDILDLRLSISEEESLLKQIHLPSLKAEQKHEKEAVTHPTTGA